MITPIELHMYILSKGFKLTNIESEPNKTTNPVRYEDKHDRLIIVTYLTIAIKHDKFGLLVSTNSVLNQTEESYPFFAFMEDIT